MKQNVLDMMKYNFIYLIFLCCFSTFSQTKNEREARINYALLPHVAKPCFIAIMSQVKSLKFYKETDGEKESYEAKFKFNKQYYSIEFSSIGVLEDIEITIKEKQIARDVLQIIQGYTNSYFDKTRFIKIQKQFVNNTTKNDEQFIQYILNNPNSLNPNFEIIAELITNKTHVIKELTFNNTGEFVTSRIVEFEDYEYVLH